MASASVATASAQSSSWTANPWAGSPEVVAAANRGGPIYDIQSIKQLKGRYFRYVDTKNWSDLRGLYTDDAVVDTTGSLGPVFYGPVVHLGLPGSTPGVLPGRPLLPHPGRDPRAAGTAPRSPESSPGPTARSSGWSRSGITCWSWGGPRSPRRVAQDSAVVLPG